MVPHVMGTRKRVRLLLIDCWRAMLGVCLGHPMNAIGLGVVQGMVEGGFFESVFSKTVGYGPMKFWG